MSRDAGSEADSAGDRVAALARYVVALRSGDRRGATHVALGLLERGVPAERLVTEVLAAAQAMVGREWQLGRLSVAVEHRASTITESVLLALSEAVLRAPDAVAEGSRGRAVVACAEGEWHTLPGRMASEVMRMRGIDVTFIGPSLPAEELASFVAEEEITAVAITCSMPMTLSGAWRSISALRELGTTVDAGGRGFGADGRWAWVLGADQWASDFGRGADLMLAAVATPAPGPRGPTGAASAIAEGRTLRRDHDVLLHDAMASALRRYPAMADSDVALRATREDLGSTLQVVASATTVSDPTVAIDFVTWFEDVLRARSLPIDYAAAAFDCVLEVLPQSVVSARAMTLSARASCSRPSV